MAAKGGRVSDDDPAKEGHPCPMSIRFPMTAYAAHSAVRRPSGTWRKLAGSGHRLTAAERQIIGGIIELNAGP